MKKMITRVLVYIILIIIFSSLGIIGFLNKPSDVPSEEVLNTNYYKYDALRGNYDELKITNKAVEYKGEILDLTSCKTYTYTEETGILKLDCKKAFRIVGHTDEVVVINMNQENHYFYKSKEKSYNGEFQRLYQMTIDSYKQSGEKELEEKLIDIDDLTTHFKAKSLSFVYIKGRNCQNECTLFNKAFSNFSSKDNTYYLDSSKLTIEDIKSLKVLSDDFPENLIDYNQTYPQVFVIGNKKLHEIIKIEGKGFDYSKYFEFADNYEVQDE